MNDIRTMHLVTTKALETAFGVSSMTIYNWRNLKKNPLPAYKITGDKKDAIRYDPQAVIDWAKIASKTIVKPEALIKSA